MQYSWGGSIGRMVLLERIRYDTRYEITDRKLCVVVTPKEEWDFLEFASFDFLDHMLYKSDSYQKKDGRGHAYSSFFWYDNNKDVFCFL